MLRWLDGERDKMALPPSRAQFIRYLIDIAKKKLEDDAR